MFLVAGAAYAVLRVEFEGEDLGDNIASLLNKRMRGRIEIGAVSWPTSALKTAVTGGWIPIELRDVKVWDDCVLSAVTATSAATGDPNADCTPDDQPDPDPRSKRKPRKLLITTPRVTAEIDAHAALFGNHNLVFRNVWLHGGEALLEQTTEPYPLHAYDQTIVSIVTAFYPRAKAGFRAGIYADSAPPVFDLRDVHIKDLNLTVHFNPYAPGAAAGGDRIAYATTARLEGVEVDAGPTPRNDSYLYMDPTDPLVAKFYVRLAVTARRGMVRLQDEGPRSAFRLPYPGASPTAEAYPPPGRKAQYQIALSDIRLNRLAQLPTEWPRRDFVANTLEIDLEARTLPCASAADTHPDPATGATLHLSGELHNYWDRPYDGAWNLALDAKNLGPTIRSCIDPGIGGDSLEGKITLTGPFIASPAIGLDLQNLDVDVPLTADQEPLRLTLAEVHGKIDLVNEQGYIDKTKALIRGGKEPGEVDLSATFGLRPFNAHANIEIAKPIDVGRFLPPQVASSVGRYLQGRLRANGDKEVGFALDDFDLSLGRGPKDRAIRVHKGRLFTDDAFATIRIEKVAVEAGRSRAVFDGLVKPLADYIDLTINGDFPDLDAWLTRFGIKPMISSAHGGTIVIRGRLTQPTINVATELGGVPCLDKVRIESSTYQSGTGQVDARVVTAGLGGELRGELRMSTGGLMPRIERLRLDGRRLEAARLCGLAGIAKGTVDALEVELAHTTIDPQRSPLDWLDHAAIFARADKLSVLGDRYERAAVCINRKDDAACRPRAGYLDGDDLAQCEQGKRGGGFCAVATATRAAGGAIDATIAKLPTAAPPGKAPRQPLPARLGGTVSLSDLPLGILDQFLDASVVGGLASMTMHLEGTPRAPQANGTLTLLRSWVAGGFLGDAQLAVEPTTVEYGSATAPRSMAGLAIRGTALAGRVQISGVIGTSAPFPVELAVSGRRIELDVLVDLTRRLGLPQPLQAWATGTVTVKTELAPTRPVEPEAWIELSELWAIYNHRSADNRRTPLRMSVVSPSGRSPATAVSLRVTPKSVELACRDPQAPSGRRACTTRFGTPAGIIEVQGLISPQAITISAAGTLDLSLVAGLVDQVFDDITGRAELRASVGGTFAKPTYEAALELVDVRARPLGGDTVLEAPSGLIKLANGSLGFTDVKLQVRDQHRDESGELHVKGNIALDGLTPTSWGVLISGKVAGKMLLVAVPGMVSSASGLARIDGDLLLTGKGTRPTVSGTLVFDPVPGCVGAATTAPDGGECRAPGELQRPIAIIPRGVRRELTFNRGSLDIETVASGDRQTYRLGINDVRTTIDGEGSLYGIDGDLEVRDGALTKLDVRLNADNIPFRIPGTLDLVLSAPADQGVAAISIAKPSEHASFEVRGEISIIDGTYTRDMSLTDQLVSLAASGPPSKAFWEEYPSIGNAELYLQLDVRRFQVNNNLANIDLKSRHIDIRNTPRDPRLSGSIDVVRGEFRIPGTRAKFTRTSGSIDFAENQRAANPRLDLASDAPDYRDLSGQNHVITLTISGALEQLQWDLKTSTGYNKSQTLSLLVLGRNAEQLRRSLGDQSLGADPTRIDPTTNPSQGFADQIVKDLAGDWVSGLLGDSLGKITGLDVLRIEIGFGSIGFHVEKKILENMKLLGQTEQTIRGSTVDARAEIKTPYRVSVQGGYLNKNFYDPAEQDIEDWSLKLVYRLFIP